MAAAIPAIVAIAKAAAVTAAVSAAMTRGKRISIPIGPFTIQVGKGKPSFSLGVPIPVGKNFNITPSITYSGDRGWSASAAVSTPIHEYVDLGATVTVGEGAKPLYAIDVTGKTASGVGASLGLEWEGTFKDIEVKTGVEVPIGKRTLGEKDKRVILEMDKTWGTKKFGIGVSKEGHSVYLTKTTDGTPYVEYEYRRVQDPEKVAELADDIQEKNPFYTRAEAVAEAKKRIPQDALAIKIGPSGLEEAYVIKEFYPKTDSGRDEYAIEIKAEWAQKMGPAFELGVKKKEGGVYQINYVPETDKVEIRALLDDGMPQLNITLQKGKKFRTELAVSDALLKRIGKEIGGKVEESILRAVPKKWVQKIPDPVIEFLAMNFPTLPKVESMKERLYETYVDKYFEAKHPYLSGWMLDLARKYARKEIDDAYLDKYFETNKLALELPKTWRTAAKEMARGGITMNEFLRSVEDKSLEKLEKEILQKRTIPSPDQYSVNERDAIIKLFRGEYDTMTGLLEKYTEPERMTILGFMKHLLQDAKEFGQFPGKVLGAGARGAWPWLTEPGRSIREVASIEGWKSIGWAVNELKEVGWDWYKGYKHPWRQFYENPLDVALDVSIVLGLGGGLAAKGAKLTAKSPVLSKALSKTALGLSTSSKVTNPFVWFWEGAKGAVKAASKIPLVQRALENYKMTALYKSILTESDRALFLEKIANQQKIQDKLAKLSEFGPDEAKYIAEVMQGIAPAEIAARISINPAVKAVADNYADIMRLNRDWLVRQGFLTKKQAATRAMLPLAKETGKSVAELYQEGNRPIYYPWMKSSEVKFSDLFWSDKLAEWKPGFLKSWKGLEVDYVKDVKEVLTRYQSGISKLKSNVQLLDDLTKAEYTLPYKLGDAILPGYVAFNPESYSQFVKTTSKLGGEFVDDLFKTREIDTSLSKAMGSLFPDEPSVLKSLGIIPEYKYFQIPKAAAEIIKGRFAPTNQFLEVFFDIPQNLWKTAVLSMRPAWVVYNTMGNTVLTTLAGVKPDAYIKALQAKYKPIVPLEAVGGTLTAAMEKIPMSAALRETLPGKLITLGEQKLLGATGLKAFGNFMNNLNSEIEKFYRKATWISESEKAVKKAIIQETGKNFFFAHGELERLAFKEMEMIPAIMEKVKKGAVLGAKEASIYNIAKSATDYTNKFLIDYSQTGYLFGISEQEVFQRVIPFWKFHKGMNLLLYKYLPTEYPERMWTLSKLNEVSKAFEVEDERPEWLRNATKLAENLYFMPSGPNPFEGLFGIGQMGLGIVSPFILAPAGYITGMDLRKMEPFTTPDTLWRWDFEKNEMAPVSVADMEKELSRQKTLREIIDKEYEQSGQRIIDPEETGFSKEMTVAGERGRFNWDVEPVYSDRIGGGKSPCYLFINTKGEAFLRRLEEARQGGRWELAPHAPADWEDMKKNPERIIEDWPGAPELVKIFKKAVTEDLEFEEMVKRLKEENTWRQISGDKAPLLDYESWQAERYDIDLAIKDLEYRLSQPTRPEFGMLMARQVPQLKLLENLFYPFAKFPTSTFLHPEPIIDKKTGEEKYPISIWLETLRLFGMPVVQVNIDEWKEKEAKKEKAEISMSFRELLSEQPLIAKEIQDSIDRGEIKIPYEYERTIPVPKLKEAFPELFPSETFFSDKEIKKDIRAAMQYDIDYLKEQAKIAIENLKWLNVDVRKAISKEIRDRRDEEIEMVKKSYAAQMDEAEYMRIYNELKSVREMRDRVAKLVKNVRPATTLKEMLSEILTGDLRATALSKIETEIAKSKTTIELAASTSKVVDFIKQQAAPDRTLQAKIDIVAKEIEKEWEKEIKPRVKIVAPPIFEEATGYLEKATYEPASYLLEMEMPVTLDDVRRLERAEELTLKEIMENADRIISQYTGIDFYGKDIIIKRVKEQAKELSKATKTRYEKKTRELMKSKEKQYENVLERLTVAKEEQIRIAVAQALEKWRKFLDPTEVKAGQIVPIITPLMGLAGAWQDARELISAYRFSEFRKRDPMGIEFMAYTKAMLKMLQDTQKIEAKAIAKLEKTLAKEKVEIPFTKAELASFRTRNDLLYQFSRAFSKFITTPTQAKFDSLIKFQTEMQKYAEIPMPSFTKETPEAATEIIYAEAGKEDFAPETLKYAFSELEKFRDVYQSERFGEERSEHFQVYDKIMSQFELVKERAPILAGAPVRVFK